MSRCCVKSTFRYKESGYWTDKYCQHENYYLFVFAIISFLLQRPNTGRYFTLTEYKMVLLTSFDLKNWSAREIMPIQHTRWFEKVNDRKLKGTIKLSLLLKAFNSCCQSGHIGIVSLARNKGILTLCWFFFSVSQFH